MTIAPRAILIANIRLIGDVILTTPLIGLLQEAYPEATIDLLVNRGTGEFLEKDPRVRQVLYSDGSRSGGYWGRIFRRYDLAINLNASDRGNLAILLASRRWRVGIYYGNRFWQDIWKKLLFSHPIRYPFPLHYARLCQVAAERLGLPVSRLEARVYWDREDQQAVQEKLETGGVSGPYFVIHPFARWRYKYWQAEKFAAVSDAVSERYDLKPVWSSSPATEEQEMLLDAAALCRCADQPTADPMEKHTAIPTAFLHWDTSAQDRRADTLHHARPQYPAREFFLLPADAPAAAA